MGAESSSGVVWLLIGLGVAWSAITGALLWDLRRREVRHLPRWGWALTIVFVSFPIGALLYLTIGRIPPGEAATNVPAPPSPGGSSPTTTVTASRGDNDERARPAPIHPESAVAGPTSGEPARRGGGPSVEATVIATSALTKAYDDTVALDRVSLAVPYGATYGLIGPNGAGKTTLLSILAGLRRPTAGRVHLDVDRRRIAVLVDTPLFEPWLTAREAVDLARHLVAPRLGTDRVDAALGEVGLRDVADRRIGGFSRGMLQRLGLASCLVGDPQVLVLDEPSSALDPAGRREVLDLIGRLSHSTTVMISTHILADVQQVCDVVGVIDRGRLRYQGPIADLLAQTNAAYTLHVRGATGDLVDALSSAPWIQTVEELAPGRLRLVTGDASQAERSLPGMVAERDLSLVSFNPATDLETAFLELTR